MKTQDLADYRATEREQARIRDLFELMPASGNSALDIGARDGYLSRRLAERFDRVVALDLGAPAIDHPRIMAVCGDARALAFDDDTFDVVVCAEVLEHIPKPGLEQACDEIVRVAKRAVVIGVPFQQDLRCGRTLCASCGGRNPPWGHVNAFDELRLRGLFGTLAMAKVSMVGSNRDRTNALSAKLMDFAGNPFGTYEQDEACVHCGAALRPPSERLFLQRVATRSAFMIDRAQRSMTAARPNWIHARFDKIDRPGRRSL